MGSNTSIQIEPENYKCNIIDDGYGKGNIITNNYGINNIISKLGCHCLDDEIKNNIIFTLIFI